MRSILILGFNDLFKILFLKPRCLFRSFTALQTKCRKSRLYLICIVLSLMETLKLFFISTYTSQCADVVRRNSLEQFFKRKKAVESAQFAFIEITLLMLKSICADCSWRISLEQCLATPRSQRKSYRRQIWWIADLVVQPSRLQNVVIDT